MAAFAFLHSHKAIIWLMFIIIFKRTQSVSDGKLLNKDFLYKMHT